MPSHSSSSERRVRKRASPPLLAALLLLAAAQGCATSGETEAERTPEEIAADVARHIEEGDRAAAAGRLDDALVKYVLALEQDVDNAVLYHRIGSMHVREGRLDLAGRHFGEALRRDPDHVPSRLGLGLVLLRRGDTAEAEELLASVPEDAPEAARAQNALGVVHDLREEFATAREHYDRALERLPRSTDVLNNYGYSYYLEGRWREAERYFRRAVDIDPSFDQGWSNLALAYLQLGEEEKARIAFGKVVDEHQALNNVGYFELLRDRKETARKRFEQASRAAPSYYPQARQNLASLRAGRARDAARPRPDGSDDGVAVDAGDGSERLARARIGKRLDTDVETTPALSEEERQAAALRRRNAEVARHFASVSHVQRQLSELGYDVGPVDGELSERTRAAIRMFQVDNGFKPDGLVTPRLERLLR